MSAVTVLLVDAVASLLVDSQGMGRTILPRRSGLTGILRVRQVARAVLVICETGGTSGIGETSGERGSQNETSAEL
ncbi:MAG: hypothetical protein ACREJN_02520 [Nitrospiraceae bacterium]